jgi:hypothetical protein
MIGAAFLYGIGVSAMKLQAVAIVCLGLAALPAFAQQPKPEPLWQAFAAVYDANKPIILKGTIIRSDWLEPRSVLWLKSEVGGERKLWRVETSPASLFEEMDRDRLAPGIEVAVRGYSAKDESCPGPCQIAGRSFTLADGSRIAPRNGEGACSTLELIKETCAVARRPGPPPQIN